MSLLIPTSGAEPLLRADKLSLRDPQRRTILLTRYTGLRRAIKDMGYQPETIEELEHEGRRLVLAEKVYALLLIYCGLNHEQALGALMECCGVVMSDGMIRRRAKALANMPVHHYIKQAVAAVLRAQNTPLDLSPERTLEELVAVAQGNLLDVASWSPEGGLQLRNSEELTRAQGAAINTLKRTVGRDGSVSWEVKMHDKSKSLEMLMKHFGLMTEKVEVTVDESRASRIEAARRRMALEGGERPAIEHEGSARAERE